MPCWGKTAKSQRAKRKVTRCVVCGRKTTTKHKHKVDKWDRRKGRYVERLMAVSTFTRMEEVCPRVLANELLAQLTAPKGTAADLPKEVVLQRTQERCKCGCGRMKVVVAHTHEKEPA